MPCNSDYLRPTERETQLRHAAALLIYARTRLGEEVPAWARKQSQILYANDSRSVTELCATLDALEPSALNALLYGGPHDRAASELAIWWADHQEADRKRIADEENKETHEALRLSAWSKLTPEERAAMDVRREP